MLSPTRIVGGEVTKAALEGLRQTAVDVINHAQAAGDAVAVRVGGELRSVVGDLDTVIRRFDDIQGRLTNDMRRTVARAEVLVRESEQALRGLLACTNDDARMLVATADISATSIAASSVPWNRHRGYVAMAYRADNRNTRGLRTGESGTFILEGAFVDFDHECGVTQARLHQIPDGDVKDLKVHFGDPRRVSVEIPPLDRPGLYQIDVGYPSSTGILGLCEKDRRVVSAFIPVQDKVTYSLGYILTSKCDRVVTNPRQVDVYVGNNDCDSGRSAENYINLSNPSCHFENVSSPQRFNGGGSATVRNEATRLVLRVDVGNADCRRVFGRVVDKAGVSAGYRLHATEVCRVSGQFGTPSIGASPPLESGASHSERVDLNQAAPKTPTGQNCDWILQASLVRRQGQRTEIFDYAPAESSEEIQLIDSKLRASWHPETRTITATITDGVGCEAFR